MAPALDLAAEQEPVASRHSGYVAPGRSALVHWRLVAVLAVVGLVIGGAYGAVHKPTYSAQAQLYVGKSLSLSNTAAIPGLAEAETQIAGDYARLITNSETINDAAKRMKVTNLPGSLSASQIAESPQINVTATASSEAVAVALANAGASALVDSVATVNATAKQTLQDLYSQYQNIQQTIANDQAQQNQLQSELGRLRASTSAADKTQAQKVQQQINDLGVAISGAQLQANAINNQYQNEYSPVQSEENVISRIGTAVSTGSNHKTTLEIALLVGLVVGLLVGVAVACAIDLGVLRRRSSIRRASGRSQRTPAMRGLGLKPPGRTSRSG